MVRTLELMESNEIAPASHITRIADLERRNSDLLKQMEAVKADAQEGLSQAENPQRDRTPLNGRFSRFHRRRLHGPPRIYPVTYPILGT